jgi:DNA mismatch repair protein MutL
MKEKRCQIKLLPDPLIDQIAAGEVIERPASVLKELIDNSLDAGAKNIEIHLENGGLDLVEVIDDGQGISREDLPLAVVAHATSKISHSEDLQNIRTFGFRGEALASMGAVGVLTLQSRVRDEAMAWALILRSGEVSELFPVAQTPGTRASLKDLFGNIPPRRKFMKSPRVETNRCQQMLEKLALSHPEVHFSLEVEGRRRFNWPAVASRGERMAQVLRLDTVALGRAEKKSVRVEICLAPPEKSRKTRAGQFFFVQNRPIRDRALSQVVWQSSREFIPDKAHPVLAVFIDMPGNSLDVNVHPSKEEVRFETPRLVASVVAEALRESVREADFASTLITKSLDSAFQEDLGMKGSSSSPKTREPVVKETQKIGSVPDASILPRGKRPLLERWAVPGALGEADAPENLPLRSFLQVHNAYIVVETDQGLSILDQHALHERILLQKMRRELLAGEVEKQNLLLPQLLEFLPDEMATLLEIREDLASVGFDFEDHGDHVLAVSSLPVSLSPEKLKDTLQGIVAASEGLCDAEALRLATLRICACRSAVKAGDALSHGEIEALLNDFEEEDYSFACEHGRPTHLRLTLSELARGFSRH